MDNGKRKYLIIFDSDHPREIVIPDSWKVTYGPLSPGAMAHNQGKGWTLRIYESKDKQRACFQGVTEFRDLSIPYEIAKSEAVTRKLNDEKPYV